MRGARVAHAWRMRGDRPVRGRRRQGHARRPWRCPAIYTEFPIAPKKRCRLPQKRGRLPPDPIAKPARWRCICHGTARGNVWTAWQCLLRVRVRARARAPGRVQPSPGCLCAAPPPGASPLMASTRSHRSPSQRHGHTPHRPCAARAKGSRRMQRLSEMAFRPSPPRAAQRVAVGRRGRRRRPGERGGPARKKG